MKIQGTSRKVMLIILAILTVVLLGVAILIGIRLQQSQAPTGANASGCTPTYNGTTSFTVCGGASGGTFNLHTCNCRSATGVDYPSCSGCNENCSDQTISVGANAAVTVDVSAPSCGVTQKDFGNATGSVQLPPGSGVCKGTGTACTSGGGGAACGGKCTQDKDCATPTAQGAVAICRGGICENRDCPTGKTLPGSNCSCSVSGRLCGQTCGQNVGLCDPSSGSVCSYLEPKCTDNEYSSVPTTCLPLGAHGGVGTCTANSDCQTGYYCNTTTKKCYLDGWAKVSFTTGTHWCSPYYAYNNGVATPAQIQQACQVSAARCGDGHIDTIAGEQCDPAATIPGCSTGMSCGSDCKCTTSPVCGGACTTAADCPNNHTCTAGKCVLNGCTDATCTNGCIPKCGGPCNPALGDSQCPTAHSCSATTNTCILTACVTDPSSCSNNNCTSTIVIPDTAIVSDELDPILLGGGLLILGILAIKFNWITNIEDLLISWNGSAPWDRKGEGRVVKKSRSKFEQEFEKKAEK